MLSAWQPILVSEDIRHFLPFLNDSFFLFLLRSRIHCAAKLRCIFNSVSINFCFSLFSSGHTYMLFITLHAKHYSKKYSLWYYLAHESLEFMTSNDLTLNNKKLIILRDMSLNKSLPPSLNKKYYFTILGLYFSWMLTSALVVDQTIWPWNSTGIW